MIEERGETIVTLVMQGSIRLGRGGFSVYRVFTRCAGAARVKIGRGWKGKAREREPFPSSVYVCVEELCRNYEVPRCYTAAVFDFGNFGILIGICVYLFSGLRSALLNTRPFIIIWLLRCSTTNVIILKVSLFYIRLQNWPVILTTLTFFVLPCKQRTCVINIRSFYIALFSKCHFLLLWKLT